MEKATGGKVKVNIYAADQLTNGNQSDGIQALMNGDPVQISMHSNLIYRFDFMFAICDLAETVFCDTHAVESVFAKDFFQFFTSFAIEFRICINQDIYDGLTPEQQAVVDECGQKADEYERYINRSSDNEIKERWESKNGVTFTEKADMDIDSFKEAVGGVDEWFVNELKSQGYEDGQDLVDLFTK